MLVCGDFNTDAGEPLHDMFSNGAWQDLTEAYRRRCACKTNFSDRDTLDMWIDYVVARRDPCLEFSADIELQTNTHKDDPFSDHQGIFAKVRIDDVVAESSLLVGVATTIAMRGPSNRRTALKKIAALAAGVMFF